MTILTKIITLTAVVSILLLVGVWGAMKIWSTPLNFVQYSEGEVINVDLASTSSSDFGVIYQEQGNFVQEYELFNNSDQIQRIVYARTSCECTKVKIGDQFYGMHSLTHPELEFAPYERKKVEIYFDPDMHGPFSLGTIKRTITLKSEDDKKTEIDFVAIVKKAGDRVDSNLIIDETVNSDVEEVQVAQARVEVTPSIYDFGDIVQSEGAVTTTFNVKNISDETIIINRLSTSCGCTTAEMSDNPLEPGEQRKMTVTFDPMVHLDQFGKIERVVYLQTSDPVNPEIEIDLRGNVIK